MKLFLKMVMVLVFLLAGCANQDETPGKETDWQVSPTFESNGVKMRGIPNRLALIDMPFIAGQEQEYIWHFWGSLQEVTGKLTILAEHKETGQSVALLQKVYIVPAKPNNGADNHLPSSLALPTPGLWKLDVFLGDRIYDSIIVEVN